MSYSAFELTAGTSCLQTVEAYCRHLTSDGRFDTTSHPTLGQVERFLTQTYYQLQAILAEQGYNPTQTDTQVVGYLENLNAVGAVGKVELTQPVTGTGEPNERFKEFRAAWRDGTAFIGSDAFEALGGARTERVSAGVVLTGTSRSRKRTVAADSDLVQPRFPRGFGVRQDLGEGRAEVDSNRTDN